MQDDMDTHASSDPDANEPSEPAAPVEPAAATEPAGPGHTVPADALAAAVGPSATVAPEAGGTPSADAPGPAPEARPSRRRRFVRRGLGGLAGIALIAVVFTAGIGLDRSGMLGGPAAAGTPTDPADFALVREAWDLLHDKYVGAADLNNRDLAYGAIEGLTKAVGDTGHTSFLTPEERARSSSALSGSFVGIGIEVDQKDGLATIVRVMPDSPAEAAGLRAGDRIVDVDGTSVTSADLDQVVALVRGEEGTSVTLTLERDGTAEPIVAKMIRSSIDLPAVSWARVPGTSVVMLRIEHFSSGSADEVKKALADILATEPSGIVLDLRGNPGGYINEGISVASEFLTSGDVHISRDAKGVITPTPVQPGGLAPTIPLVVLVDSGTASTSEIVAGGLQDAGRAAIVGQRTFGTGTVLSEVPLSDGSALRIGVIEWLTPKGRTIWHEGLAPDDSVALATGVSGLVPEDLVGLNVKALADSGDAQLLKALDLLKAGQEG
jgi:carboxyl-terminal processing protease